MDTSYTLNNHPPAKEITLVFGTLAILVGIIMAVNHVGGYTTYGVFFAIVGSVLFLPGFYCTRIAYYAYKGYKGSWMTWCTQPSITRQVYDNSRQCSPTQIITGDGIFKTAEIEKLVKEVGLAQHSLSYAIVSIMGPQSSGKSTLLNHLFETNFRAMDAVKGRSQTTKGIWIAECAGIEPCTLVMDLEGTDGREREEAGNTAFEKKSAVFALVVSDIVLINMWCHDIGREQAANRPLLKTMFEVIMTLSSPHKTTLMFVIRDKTKTPLENLELDMRKDIQKIWDSVQKPVAHKETSLSEFFNVEVVALCNFERDEVEFKEQVDDLRERFSHSKSPGGLAGDRKGVVCGSEFSLSAQEMWKLINENKDLDIPSYKALVATVRCEQIVRKFIDSFDKNEDWCELKQSITAHYVPDFGKSVNLISNSCLSKYDEEVAQYDDGVRRAKREELEEKIVQLVEPAFQLMLRHIWSETLDELKRELENSPQDEEGFSTAARVCTQSIMDLFDSRCADASYQKRDFHATRNDFQRDIDANIDEVRARNLQLAHKKFEQRKELAINLGISACTVAAAAFTGGVSLAAGAGVSLAARAGVSVAARTGVSLAARVGVSAISATFGVVNGIGAYVKYIKSSKRDAVDA